MAFTCRNLEVAEKKELAKWLKLHNLQLNRRNRQKLTDMVPVARMFKRIHPKLINMHHYKHGSDYYIKLQNWKIFNEKVLTKLGLGHSSLDLEQLTKGHDGAIESLLYDLITVGRSRRISKEFTKRCSQKFSKSQRTQKKSLQSKSESLKHSLTHIPQQARILLTPPKVFSMDLIQSINGKMVNVTEDLVTYEDYMDVLLECQEKDSCINSVRHKIQYLESLTKVKEERIEDLMKQLKRLTGESCNQ